MRSPLWSQLGEGAVRGSLAPTTAPTAAPTSAAPATTPCPRSRAGQRFDTGDLTVQFVPTTGTVEFSFVFASEEYTEYVDSQYNDVFAAFVNAINHLRNTLQYRDNANDSLRAI